VGSSTVDNTDTKSVSKAALEQPTSAARTDLPAILWENAVKAFVQAILVLALGSVAVGMASGVWSRMSPSAPPGLKVGIELETVPHPGHTWWALPLVQHRLGVMFAALFAFHVWSAIGPCQRGATTWVRKIGCRVSEEWFGLIVGNAFGALVTALVVAWVQQFTVSHWLWSWLTDSVLSVVHDLASRILGASRSDGFQAWLDWYVANRLKFAFWFFYLAAIADDLGLPNFKTLVRWGRRRIRQRTAG
jgi:hypothetical protein